MKIQFESGKSSDQIIFDYSGAKLVLDHFVNNRDNLKEILNNQGYNKILEHSRKYSSNPLTKANLLNSLKGKKEGFDFSQVAERKNKYTEILDHVKNNQLNIQEEYGKLCQKYLPEDYRQKALIYFVIGGYNGIAFDRSVCLNIDYEPFRRNIRELKFYLAHELFHIGFEHYQKLPDIHKARKISDLKNIILSLTMNEGLATLTPYHKRIEMGEISDDDYQILLDYSALNNKIKHFDRIIRFLNDNLDQDLDNEIMGNILNQCSVGRLFYVVGCQMGLEIANRWGNDKIKELIKLGPEKYFEIYYQVEKTM